MFNLQQHNKQCEEEFENLINEKKKEVGDIPENTCPNVDKLIKENNIVWKELEYLDRNAHRYESAEDLVKDFPSLGWTNTVEDIAEQLRKDNEQLRNLGKFWYEEYKDIKSFITTSNTTLLKKFLESERERLEEYKYADPVSQGEYSGHAEGHNFILDKIISQYQSLLETLK
jgi:hypothetical protein